MQAYACAVDKAVTDHVPHKVNNSSHSNGLATVSK